MSKPTRKTLLLEAITQEDTKTIRKLLSHGIISENETTNCLDLAIKKRHLPNVIALIEGGMYINNGTDHAIRKAMLEGYHPITDYLFQKGNYLKKNPNLALKILLAQNKVEEVKTHIQNKVSSMECVCIVNIKWLMKNDSREAIQFVFENTKKPNEVINTAVHTAFENGRLETARWLTGLCSTELLHQLNDMQPSKVRPNYAEVELEKRNLLQVSRLQKEEPILIL